jgi:hypothetical protein
LSRRKLREGSSCSAAVWNGWQSISTSRRDRTLKLNL